MGRREKVGALGHLPFKIQNFGNSTCPMDRFIPAAQTRPKLPRAWLLFSQAGYKRAVPDGLLAVLGTTILSNGK